MKPARDKVQILISFVFLICTLLTGTSSVPADRPELRLFYTPSVEPLVLEKISATKPPSGSLEKIDTMGMRLRPGEIINNPDLLPQQLGRRGMKDFGLASVTGNGDLMAIWITRDEETLYQIVSITNPALYGIRDPVTGHPIGTGFIDRLEDWEGIRNQRSDLIAESVGSLPSLFGAGAAGAGGGAAGKGMGLISFSLGGFDILGGVLERYFRSGRIFWKMVDTEQDLERLFFEAHRIEVQQSGGSS